jgi:formate dehydrogenase alpha subunit
VAGLATSFGSGAMTNSINEIPASDVMFIIGSNPTEAHPVIGAKMRQGLANGAKLIVADPRKTQMAQKAHIWLRLKPGTDVALINGLLHIILENGWQDSAFIDKCTTGFDQVAHVVKDYPPERVSTITGVPGHLLLAAAKLYATSDKAAIFYTLGITEHTSGTDNVMSLANLAMATGNVGKPSAGVNPLRGQNNVQGACDMGALPNVFPGYQMVKFLDVRNKFAKAWGVPMPENPGMMLPDMFAAALNGQLKAMYIMGEDPVLTDANAHHVRRALESLDFLLVQNLFLTETAKLADVVLPAASFAEKSGTFTNTERRIQLVNQAISPIGGSKPDWQIIAELSTRMGYVMDYADTAEIMAEVASLTPVYAGVSHERLIGDGLQWPVPDADHPGTQFLHTDGNFTCGLGYFTPIEYLPPAELPDDDYPLLLTTGRILYHYNVSTFGYSKELTAFRDKEQVMIHPADAAKLSLANGEWVTVFSRRGAVQAAAWLTDAVPPGVVWMSFHFPASPTNNLTNDAADKVTKTYEYKVCAVKIQKSG